MSSRHTNSKAAVNTTGGSGGAKTLQERLHELLTRLAAAIELVRHWPESEGDDSQIHVESTTKLLAAIKAVAASVQHVDGVVKADTALRKNLQECLIPLDLLDLLDVGGGLNPDCFSRALLKEALGQLAGLKRRKMALEMLGAAVQTGLEKRDAASQEKISKKNAESLKRKRADQVQQSADTNKNKDDNSKTTSDADADGGDTKEPPAKKQFVER